MSKAQAVRQVDFGFAANRAFTSNQTNSSFTSRPATVTRPAATGPASGCYNLGRFGTAVMPRHVILWPFATGGNNVTFKVRLTGYRTIRDADQNESIFFAYIVAELACVCGNYPGIAGTSLLGTEFLADTLTLTFGNAGVDVTIVSPANDTPAHALVDLKGAEYLQFDTDRDSSATAVNCLFAEL